MGNDDRKRRSSFHTSCPMNQRSGLLQSWSQRLCWSCLCCCCYPSQPQYKFIEYKLLWNSCRYIRCRVVVTQHVLCKLRYGIIQQILNNVQLNSRNLTEYANSCMHWLFFHCLLFVLGRFKWNPWRLCLLVLGVEFMPSWKQQKAKITKTACVKCCLCKRLFCI